MGPACLPTSDYLPMNATKDQCYISGWGTLSQGNFVWYVYYSQCLIIVKYQMLTV